MQLAIGIFVIAINLFVYWRVLSRRRGRVRAG
jgi:hypothetical protein